MLDFFLPAPSSARPRPHSGLFRSPLPFLLFVLTLSTSSAFADWGRDGVTLYEGENFRGRSETFTSDSPDLGRFGAVGNDSARSITVADGCVAILYEHQGYRGLSLRVDRDISSLRRTRLGFDSVSSLEVDCRQSRSDGYDPRERRDHRDGPYSDYDDETLHPGDGAVLYEDDGYRGKQLRFDYDLPQLERTPLGNDRASSLRLARGCTVTLFNDSFYRGSSATFDRDIPDLGKSAFGNDRASSARIACVRNDWEDAGWVDAWKGGWNDRQGVILYSDEGFRGRSELLLNDDRRLSDNQVGNDRISSIRVTPGCQVTLYSDADFRGRSSTFREDVPSLSRTEIGNDRASSVQVRCRGGGWGRDSDRDRGDRGRGDRGRGDRDGWGDSPRGDSHSGVVLYSDTRFRGRSEIFTYDVPDLEKSQLGNDRASSIQVPRHCEVTLYSDSRYRGSSVRLTSDVADLGGTPVGNDRVSSIRVSCRRR